MYYVIALNGVVQSASLSGINKKMNASFDDEEFKVVGADRICQITDTDLDFVRDKHRMSAIAFQNFFMKDTRPTMYFIVQLIIMFIILIGVFSK